MAGLQPNVYAAILATMPAAAAALVLRLVARRMIRMKYWFDDLFAVLAYVSGSANAAALDRVLMLRRDIFFGILRRCPNMYIIPQDARYRVAAHSDRDRRLEPRTLH